MKKNYCSNFVGTKIWSCSLPGYHLEICSSDTCRVTAFVLVHPYPYLVDHILIKGCATSQNNHVLGECDVKSQICVLLLKAVVRIWYLLRSRESCHVVGHKMIETKYVQRVLYALNILAGSTTLHKVMSCIELHTLCTLDPCDKCNIVVNDELLFYIRWAR